MRPLAGISRSFVVGAALTLALATPAVAADDVKVVASGLDNPRGIDHGPGGYLYIAEAGRGGAGPCAPGPEGQRCYGPSGAVTRVEPDGDDQERIRTGLPSVAGADGGFASGPQGISFPRKGIRSLGYLTIGLSASPAQRSTFGEPGALLATLQRLHPDGRHRTLADLGAYEAANDPDANLPGTDVDTNPTGVYGLTNRHAFVTDSAGNSVLSVRRTGEISLLAVIPFGEAPAPEIPGFPVPPGTPIPFQSVPTSVAVADDGSIYVSQLTGEPFPTGGAKIWRIPAGGGTAEEFASGLTLVTDLAFGKNGSVYVVEIQRTTFIGPEAPGALIRIKPDGTREELAAGTLTAPYGLALHGEYAYVTNKSTFAGEGEVVRVRLPDDAGDDNGDDDHGDD
jgi:hypothetical protein